MASIIDESYLVRVQDGLAALEQRMSSPEIASDHRKFRELANEHSHLKLVVARAEIYFRLRHDFDENSAMVADHAVDADLKALATEELVDIEERLPAAEKELLMALVPDDPKNARGAIMEIRAGTGGDEAALFAGDLYRMYSRYAESHGWTVKIIDASTSNVGGYKEIVCAIDGTDAYGHLKFESGGHRVQRVPATESQGRIHTSAATVGVFPEADDKDDLPLSAEDLRIDIFRSSGPGGQSVNTTSSAVRITHLPTGIVAQSQDERSQHRNKDNAMKVLRARILDAKEREENERMADERRTLIGSGDRSQRVRTYNFPQNRLSDHRINLTMYSLDRIMEGELTELVESLRNHDLELKIETATDEIA
jgi:peptide chain release factor 1